MFLIKINEFKCYRNLTVELPLNNSVTLLSGISGSGKTTILESIYWVLYDTVKQVAPHKIKNAKTSVEISFNNIFIKRSKNPNRLFFTKDNISYEDEAAQQMIYQEFGTHYVWLCSSYISQNNKNIFISSISNDVKVKILNEIAFHDEDPTEIIEKITEVLSLKKTKYELLVEKFRSKEPEFLEIEKLYDSSKILDDVKKYCSKLEEMKELLVISDKNELILNNIEIMRKNLKFQQLKELPKKYEVSYLDELKKKLSLSQKKSELQNKLYLFSYDKKLLDDSITQEFINEIINKEIEYNNFIKRCNELNVRDFSEVSRMIALMNDIVSKNNNIVDAKKYYSLLSDYNKFSISQDIPQVVENIIEPTKIINDDLYNNISENKKLLDNLSNEILKLEHQKKIHKLKLNCPECDASIKLEDNKLVKFTNVNFDEKELILIFDKYNKVKKEIKLLEDKINFNNNFNLSEQNRYNNEILKRKKYEMDLSHYKTRETYRQEKLQEIKNKLDDIHCENIKEFEIIKNSKVYSNNEIENIKYRIRDLELLKEIEKPKVSSVYLKKILDNYNNFLSSEKIRKELENIRVDTSFKEIQNEIKLVENTIIEYNSTELHNNSVEKVRSEIISEIEEIENKLIKINYSKSEIFDNISEIETILYNHRKHNEYLEKLKQYDQYKKYILEYLEYVSKIQEIRRVAIEAESTALENVVNVINSNLNDISSMLFDNECNITLNLHKTIKTTKTIKPIVNFSISYKGNTYDQINHMSGGEMDRVSLAITMGFNSLSSFPLLLLDENLASLDCDTRDSAIKMIRKYTNKSVIVVAHDSIEGFFDKVINVENYNSS